MVCQILESSEVGVKNNNHYGLANQIKKQPSYDVFLMQDVPKLCLMKITHFPESMLKTSL